MTVVLGIAIDAAVLTLGLTLPVNLTAAESPAIQFVEWTGALALTALVVWRFREGALKSGYKELVSNLVPVYRRLK